MKEKINQYLNKLDKPFWGLSFYFIVALIVYANSYGTSLIDDSLGIFLNFKTFGWSGFWTSYDFSSIYLFHDFVHIVLYKIFRNNNFLWFLSTLFIHSLSSYYLYKFFLNVLNHSNRKEFRQISFVSSLIFLAGAYNTENIFWLATLHYVVSMCFLALSLYYISMFKGKLTIKYYFLLFTGFCLIITMHEISYFFPIAYLIVFYYYQYENWKKEWKNSILFIGPFILACIIILSLTYIFKGHIIPHYGIEHIEGFSVYNFFYTFLNYLIKHIFFIHNFDFHVREKLYNIDPRTIYIITSLCVLTIAASIYFRRKFIRLEKDIILFGILSILFYIPVSNMYFNWHFPIINDRLGYFLFAFLSPLFILLSYSSLKSYGFSIAAIYLLFNIYFLRQNIFDIQESIKFSEKIVVPSYKPYMEKNPLILNLPFNYQGLYCFRKNYRLNKAIDFFYNKKVDYTVATSMPFFQPTDSIEIVRKSDSVLLINLRAPGSWLMKESLGGGDYENEDVRVDYADDNQSALITIKDLNKSQPILYCTGNRGFVEYK